MALTSTRSQGLWKARRTCTPCKWQVTKPSWRIKLTSPLNSSRNTTHKSVQSLCQPWPRRSIKTSKKEIILPNLASSTKYKKSTMPKQAGNKELSFWFIKRRTILSSMPLTITNANLQSKVVTNKTFSITIMSLFGEAGTVRHLAGDTHVVILLRKWVIA